MKKTEERARIVRLSTRPTGSRNRDLDVTSPARRQLLGYLMVGSVFACLPSQLRAQRPGRIYRLGFLAFGDPVAVRRNLAPFVQALSQAGFEEGRNLQIELRVAGTESESLDAAAANLTSNELDVIFVPSPNGALAIRRTGSSVPVVALLGSDPVADGLVASLARPGANLTGVNVLAIDTNQKRLQLLTELYPNRRKVRYLTQRANLRFVDETRPYAAKLGLGLEAIAYETLAELRERFPKSQAIDEALIVGGTPVNYVYREEIVRLANQNRAAIIYPSIEYALAGGLISYGGDLPFAIGRAMQMVVQILKGAKPHEIPFEQATRTNLTINKKTAASLGIEIPAEIVLRADGLLE